MLRDELTPGQFERVGLLALGYNLKQIAFVLGLSHGAMKMRFKEIYERTGTSDKLELAIRFAREEFMGYDNDGAGSSTWIEREPPKFEADRSSRSRPTITPVIFPEKPCGAKLSPEDICEHF